MLGDIVMIDGEYMDVSNKDCGLEITYHSGGYQVLGYEAGTIFEELQFAVICKELDEAVHLFANKMNEWGMYK